MRLDKRNYSFRIDLEDAKNMGEDNFVQVGTPQQLGLQQTITNQGGILGEDHFEPIQKLPCEFSKCSSYPHKCSECKHNKKFNHYHPWIGDPPYYPHTPCEPQWPRYPSPRWIQY
jgi:hypothetical protein